MGYEEIVFLTGAGVSKASGIPTFRGEGGLYSKQFEVEGQFYDPKQFISYKLFKSHPKALWNYVQGLLYLVRANKPGRNHQIIHELC